MHVNTCEGFFIGKRLNPLSFLRLKSWKAAHTALLESEQGAGLLQKLMNRGPVFSRPSCLPSLSFHPLSLPNEVLLELAEGKWRLLPGM